MFRLDEGLKVTPTPRAGGFRLSINGLAALVQQALGQDPFAACVVSLVDRLMHRAEVVRIEGNSCRAKEGEERVAARAKQRTSKPAAGTRKGKS